MISYGPGTGLAMRWILPLHCPPFPGEISELESIGNTKTWVVGKEILKELLTANLFYENQMFSVQTAYLQIKYTLKAKLTVFLLL